MNESAPKLDHSPSIEEESNVERLSDWRELQEQAPEKAQAVIEGIPGFEAMESGERVVALEVLQNELAEDNSNRFIGRIIATEIRTMMDSIPDSVRAEYQLPLRTPAERAEAVVTAFPVSPQESGYAHTLDYVHATNDNQAQKVADQQEPSPGWLQQTG
jgi:hypothetical protein